MNEVPPVATYTPDEPKASSGWMKWLVGCGCGCLVVLLLAGVLGYVFYSYRLKQESVERQTRNETDVTRRTMDRTRRPDPAVPPIDVPVVAMTTFTSSIDGTTGDLKDHFVPFTFDYPSTWERDNVPGQYLRVRHDEDNFTQENMTVTWYTGTFTDDIECSRLLNDFAEGRKADFPNYKKLGEGRTRFGKYEGYEIRVQYSKKTTEKGLVQLWMRAIIVHDKGPKGVFVITMGSTANPEIKSIDDLGTKGELPGIIRSFRFLD